MLTQRLDMVVTTRSRASDDAYRWGHQYGNSLFNLILKRSFGITFEDVSSGYRVLSRRYICSFPALSQGFEIGGNRCPPNSAAPPSHLFSSLAGLFMAAAVTLFYPVLVIYLETGLVPRFPTLIVSLALLVIAIVLLACGLILDAVKHTQLEIRRLLYLNAGER